MASVNRATQKVALTLVLALQSLFPPHPLAFSRLLELNGTKKHAPLVKRAAATTDYLGHLAPGAYGGVGALGMFPGMSADDGQGRRCFYGTFFAADFDGHPVYDLEPLADTLEGEGVPTYLTCGTSGRGGHLYGFVAGLVPQWKVYGVVKGVQRMAEDAGLGVPEIRPSCEFGRGSPIFLPYRGALKDGYGYNPLLDPRRDLEPVKLEHALTEVQRVSGEALERFWLKMAKQPRPVRTRRTTRFVGAVHELEAADSLTGLLDEFGRVSEHFKEPHRQHLVMALTAYGVRSLGLDAATVRGEVTAFVKKHDADELPRRLEALERTLTKFASSPRSVAWTPYYRSAGLTPPGKLGVTEVVLAKLEAVTRLLLEREWKGVAGSSDRSVLVALLLVAAEHGTPHRSGVAVSVSVRDLALRSGVGDKTVRNALARLKTGKLVARLPKAGVRVGEAGSLVVVADEVPELPHSFPLIGGLKEWGQLCTHCAFRHGKLGKSAASLLVALLGESRPLTRRELAELLGREVRTLNKPLKRLADHKVVTVTDALYSPDPAWQEALGVVGGPDRGTPAGRPRRRALRVPHPARAA